MGAHFSIPMVFSQQNTGLLVGLNGVFGTTAGILAPVFSGLIIDMTGQYEYALYMGAAIAIVGALCMAAARIKPIGVKPAAATPSLRQAG
ncbi:hypothetical protein [Martelella alba]|uniref:hypothetical protein n=1 Tax=Martelella alba TaxID=2590451 RepID=UPI0018AD334E|nr:hypothetical protein [Martelella alba]